MKLGLDFLAIPPYTLERVKETQGMTPTAEKEITVKRNGFDLESKTEVNLVKKGKFVPVQNMNEFMARLGNDSNKILEIVNSGLEEWASKELANNNDGSWIVVDDAGKEIQFEGKLIEGEKYDSMRKTVLELAKFMFGYPADKPPKDSTKDQIEVWRKQKEEARNQAQNFLLSNPATLASLTK